MDSAQEFSSPTKSGGRVRDGDQSGRSQSTNTTVMPVTVKMLREAKKEIPQSIFSIDGQDLQMVFCLFIYLKVLIFLSGFVIL